MKAGAIKSSIDAFKLFLKDLEEGDYRFFPYECLANFKQNWDIERLDFDQMYKASFSSKISQSLWVGRHFMPKQRMLDIIKSDDHFVRFMFQDLLDESKDLAMRVSRFMHHCDELLNDLMKVKKNVIAHDHQNYKMISIYLSFTYPEKYCIYDFKLYRNAMEILGAQTIPEIHDHTKFQILMRSLYANYLSKDEELMTILHERIIEPHYYQDSTNLVSYLFLRFLRKLASNK